jgi:hypothetical protein
VSAKAATAVASDRTSARTKIATDTNIFFFILFQAKETPCLQAWGRISPFLLLCFRKQRQETVAKPASTGHLQFKRGPGTSYPSSFFLTSFPISNIFYIIIPLSTASILKKG